MYSASPIADRPPPPSRWQAGLFLAKARCLQARRALEEMTRGRARRFQISAEGAEYECLAESRTELYPSDVRAEFALQAGKVQNLRRAATYLNGLKVPAREVFSFWAHIPRPARHRGFAAGRELREGCIVPSVGGGLCQLSNALYDVALQAGFEITERHPHSRQVPGSMAEAGRDATVFWNYVDLRFRPPADCRLEVYLTARELVVRLRGTRPTKAGRIYDSGKLPLAERPSGNTEKPVESCETCGVADCFRHSGPIAAQPQPGVTAWLVDAWWPEFHLYLRQNHAESDWLFLPLDGLRFHIGRYRWPARGFARCRQAPLLMLRRSWVLRNLSAQGAERQRALLHFDRELADHYARGLPATALHLVVSQALLPHLWRAGVLGGRTFDVLMTRLPMSALQQVLDCAALRHPQSRTLADFRAPASLAADEAAGLAEARRWITPHSVIAGLAGKRAVKLPWQIPDTLPKTGSAGSDLFFPASTLARKGAYELAEATRALGLRVQLGGPQLEGNDCWRGVKTAPAAPCWAGVGTVVLPAWVEHQPRRLLQAVAAGVPVIASEACGLAGVAGVTIIPAGDLPMLRAVLDRRPLVKQG